MKVIEKIVRSPLMMIMWLILFGIIYVGAHKGWAAWVLFSYFGLFAIYIALIVIHNLKNPNKKIALISFIPYELREDDEGIQWYTFKATRKVYIFYSMAIPFGVLALTIFEGIIPYFPIWLLILFGIIQVSIYWFEIRKAFKEEA